MPRGEQKTSLNGYSFIMTEASEIDACVIIFTLEIGPAYHSAYLRDGTGIGVQYCTYCSPIPMLQTGISFKALRGGHKKCPGFKRTYIAQPRLDFPRAASSVDKMQNDCNLKRGI